jgi:hypothetical protein
METQFLLSDQVEIVPLPVLYLCQLVAVRCTVPVVVDILKLFGTGSTGTGICYR